MLLFNLSNTHSWTTYWRANIWRRGWGYNDCQFIFQQVNDFLFDKKNNSITFKFFGITTIHYLPEGSIFCVELYLILSDDQIDANLTIGECYLPEEVNSSNEKKQADYKIIDLDEDKEYKSFEIHNSEQIAGIPEDKTLSDKTAEAISNGQLLDYSDEEN